jgi:spore germination protein YaaH
MSNSRVEELRAENKAIREKIALFRNNDGSANLKGEIVKFVEESKRNLNNMNNKIIEENSRQNEALHGLTTQYEAVLKKQIELLT